MTLGQETINTQIYTQLDATHCHIMTEHLQRYTLIGEPALLGRAVKILRLAAFAPALSPSMDYNIRVYVVEDTPDALEVCRIFRLIRGSLRSTLDCSITKFHLYCKLKVKETVSIQWVYCVGLSQMATGMTIMVSLSGVRRTILTFRYEVFMCAGVFFHG